MSEVNDEMALAREIAREVLEKSSALLPLSDKESKLLHERYLELQRNILQYDKFVRQDKGGVLFQAGFELQQFDYLLQLQLHELAAQWNANPICMARALVIFPRLYESARNNLSTFPAEKTTEATLKRYTKHIETNKRRLESRSFEYDEKPLSNKDSLDYGGPSKPASSTFGKDIAL